MSGPSKSQIATQNSITQQQLDLARRQDSAATEDRNARIDLMKPAIDFNKAIAGGDQQSLFTAAAPMISEITKASKQSKEAAYDNVPAGAGRDIALAMNDRSTRDAVAGTKNNLFNSAFDKLANIGSGLGSFSLNETGAAISGFGSAANTNQSAMQASAAKKASTMGFLGQLAGAGGSALSGGFAKGGAFA